MFCGAPASDLSRNMDIVWRRADWHEHDESVMQIRVHGNRSVFRYWAVESYVEDHKIVLFNAIPVNIFT